MFEFTPLTDEQLDEMSLVADGIYNFEVAKCERKTSQSGNAMAKLQLIIWDNNGAKRVVFDYLVFSEVNLCIRKVKHFCDTVGLLGEYNAGKIPEDLAGLSGKVHIGIQEPQPKGDGTYYGKKNIVIDYVVMPKESGTLAPPPIDTSFDDQIPF